MPITITEKLSLDRTTSQNDPMAHTAFMAFLFAGDMTCRLHCGKFYFQAQSTVLAENDWHGVHLSLYDGSTYNYIYFDSTFQTDEFREMAVYAIRLDENRLLTVRRNGIVRGSATIEDIPEAYWRPPRMGPVLLTGSLAEDGRLDIQTMLHFATALPDDDMMTVERIVMKYAGVT